MAKHTFSINQTQYTVEVGARRGNSVQVTVNGTAYDVELKSAAVSVPAVNRLRASVPPPAAFAAAPVASLWAVTAPMAGLVLSIKVAVGDAVAEGDELLNLEAMKMENAITAERAGVVKRIAVEPNQVVNQGDVLLELE